MIITTGRPRSAAISPSIRKSRSSVSSTSSDVWPAAKLKLNDPSSGSTVIVGVTRSPPNTRATSLAFPPMPEMSAISLARRPASFSLVGVNQRLTSATSAFCLISRWATRWTSDVLP